MQRFRYQLGGNWYRGNTHLHSVVSDGRKTIPELGKLYRGAGYDFLCMTDHWQPSSLDTDHTGDGLLWINGVELNAPDARGVEYHYVALGDFTDIHEGLSLEDAILAVHQQGGFVILAHPFWMGLTFDDCERFPAHAVELYNHICWHENGKGDGVVFWENMLKNNKGLLGIACDDAHFIYDPPAWKGGWVMANATECTRTSILQALRTGNYYSSCGPEFHQIEYHAGKVQVTTSPVQLIRLVGPGKFGKHIGAAVNAELTSAEIEIPQHWSYAYLEIEDHQRRRAWTNTLFVTDPVK